MALAATLAGCAARTNDLRTTRGADTAHARLRWVASATALRTAPRDAPEGAAQVRLGDMGASVVYAHFPLPAVDPRDVIAARVLLDGLRPTPTTITLREVERPGALARGAIVEASIAVDGVAQLEVGPAVAHSVDAHRDTGVWFALTTLHPRPFAEDGAGERSGEAQEALRFPLAPLPPLPGEDDARPLDPRSGALRAEASKLAGHPPRIELYLR